MMDIDTPDFSSKDEEIQFWMDLAHQMHQRKDDVERELEEFQENSQMLEKELETSLEQAEKTIRELQQRNARLVNEVEQLRVRQDQQATDCAMFQTRAQELQIIQEQQLKYIRELEQKNDDLERAHRISKATEEEFEAKFNLEIEKNALLESELDEKDGLKVIVQRLMDEIRDLKQEIHVQERRQPDNDKSADRVRNHVDSNKLQVEMESHTPPSSPIAPQNITPSVNSTTPQVKSKVNSVLRRTKILFNQISRRRSSTSKLTPAKAGNLKFSPAKSGPSKVTPAKSNPLKLTPARFVPLKLTPAKSTPFKLATAKLTPLKIATVKSTALKFSPANSVESIPGKFTPLVLEPSELRP